MISVYRNPVEWISRWCWELRVGTYYASGTSRWRWLAQCRAWEKKLWHREMRRRVFNQQRYLRQLQASGVMSESETMR